MQNVLSSTRVPLLVTVEIHSYAVNVRFATLPRGIPIPIVVVVNPSRVVSLPHISSHNNDEVCRVAVILSPECIAGGIETATYIARHIMSYISCLISKLRGQKTGRAILKEFVMFYERSLSTSVFFTVAGQCNVDILYFIIDATAPVTYCVLMPAEIGGALLDKKRRHTIFPMTHSSGSWKERTIGSAKIPCTWSEVAISWAKLDTAQDVRY